MIISVIQHFMTLSAPEQIFQAENVLNLPIHTYLKDTTGKVLAGNDCMAHDAGFSRGSDLVDLTDFDMAWSKEAIIIRKNDDQVRAEGKILSFVEKGRIHSGKLCRYASLKAPLRGHSKKIIGIMGVSFFLEEESSPVTSLFPELSKQQEKCLYYLVHGMTMKEIAHTLGLSPKTVEHYLDAVKTKLHCGSRSELVAHAIQLGILQQSSPD